MAGIHKLLKFVRTAIAARRGIIARHLIAPAAVKGMLLHRQHLDMRIAHFLHIGSQLFCGLPVIIKLAAVLFLSVFIQLRRLPHPGAQMYLIDRHGRCLRIGLCSSVHPLLIAPLITAQVPDN